MQVVLIGGSIKAYSLNSIANVTFENLQAHSCGADSVHNPDLTYGSVTDQEGNVYKTIVIDKQVWMAGGFEILL